jgi:hypothetical protein
MAHHRLFSLEFLCIQVRPELSCVGVNFERPAGEKKRPEDRSPPVTKGDEIAVEKEWEKNCEDVRVPTFWNWHYWPHSKNHNRITCNRYFCSVERRNSAK